MHNRPFNTFDELDGDPGPGGWRTDHQPMLRLACLVAAVALPFVVVAVRLHQLQLGIGERAVADLDPPIESVEPVTSRDGRILGLDGRVLAEDVRRFRVLAHYRWLEEPPDPDWIRRRALSKLDRRDRRKPELVAAAEADVLAERAALWSGLARTADVSPAILAARRESITRRVERIVASVERRRAERDAERAGDTGKAESQSRPWWERLAHAITTPPRRGAVDPIVVQEELDYHVVVDDVSLETAAAIEAEADRFPGLRVEVATQRSYPSADLAAHVVGNRLPARDEDIALRKETFPEGDPLAYAKGDRIGRTGVERVFDRHLHGMPGTERIVRNRHGEILESSVLRRPRVGHDVVLTLDLELQERAERLLDDALEHGVDSASGEPVIPPGGAIVVLDVHTGAIVAAASAPRFELTDVADPTPDRWQALLDDPRRPFFPRCTRMTLAPGSVFKTLTAIALLQEGIVDPSEHFFCQGFLDTPSRHRCYVYRHYGRGHGNVDLADALGQSCNVYFFAAAREMGPKPLVKWAERFGFGRPTGVELPGERGGHVPKPPSNIVPVGASDEEWYEGDTLGLAIGQSRLTCTPLQVARLMAAVANDGYLVTPHVARRIERPGELGTVVDPPEPRRIPELRPATLARIREGLVATVNNPNGTGYRRVRLDEVAIAGKTGTAEVGGDREDHAWFAGYVPAESPRYAFCITLEHAGSGGLAAGPIARRLVQEMLAVELVEPR